MPVLPDHAGACVSGIVPALIARPPTRPPWMPEIAWAARCVVLLVLDGLGWDQLQDNLDLMPTLAAMYGGPITTVCPSTTAAALTSITTGTAPGEHGVVGYRVRDSGSVINTLRWRHDDRGDARQRVPADQFQPIAPFLGYDVPVITKAEFATTGFTDAHLRGTRWHPWSVVSSIGTQVKRLTDAGEPLVYAYYDGIDKISHLAGLGDEWRDELGFADRLVADVIAHAAAGTAVLVTADHGQVHVGDRTVTLHSDVQRDVAFQSGEGRFRWLHARQGRAQQLLAACAAHYSGIAWVRSVQQVIDDGWFGHHVTAAARGRLGDVALVPFEPVSFHDPADTGNIELIGRHGSLTSAEMRVPLLAAVAT